jgi:hypothetical protein
MTSGYLSRNFTFAAGIHVTLSYFNFSLATMARGAVNKPPTKKPTKPRPTAKLNLNKTLPTSAKAKAVAKNKKTSRTASGQVNDEAGDRSPSPVEEEPLEEGMDIDEPPAIEVTDETDEEELS